MHIKAENICPSVCLTRTTLRTFSPEKHTKVKKNNDLVCINLQNTITILRYTPSKAYEYMPLPFIHMPSPSKNNQVCIGTLLLFLDSEPEVPNQPPHKRLALDSAKNNCHTAARDGENLIVPEFFAAGIYDAAIMLCAVKGGVRL